MLMDSYCEGMGSLYRTLAGVLHLKLSFERCERPVHTGVQKDGVQEVVVDPKSQCEQSSRIQSTGKAERQSAAFLCLGIQE